MVGLGFFGFGFDFVFGGWFVFLGLGSFFANPINSLIK